jgi:hypothetical protein
MNTISLVLMADSAPWARAVQHQHGMGAGGNAATDLDQTQARRLTLAVGHDDAGALVGTDCAECVGVGRVPVLGRQGSRPAHSVEAGFFSPTRVPSCHHNSFCVSGGRCMRITAVGVVNSALKNSRPKCEIPTPGRYS